MEFKERLKELRNQAGLSQVDLAIQLGLSKSTIGAYEVGQIDPSIFALKNMARFIKSDSPGVVGA